jgi:hypothetical protein
LCFLLIKVDLERICVLGLEVNTETVRSLLAVHVEVAVKIESSEDPRRVSDCDPAGQAEAQKHDECGAAAGSTSKSVSSTTMILTVMR